MDITLDFKSKDPRSTLGRTYIFFRSKLHYEHVLEHQPHPEDNCLDDGLGQHQHDKDGQDFFD